MAKTKQEIRTAEKLKGIKAAIKAVDKDILAQERALASSQKAQESYEAKANRQLEKLRTKKEVLENKL
jgi:hypothetical protein